MSKKIYKELQLCLKDSFTASLGKTEHGYNIVKGVADWVKHSDMKPTKTHTDIICDIFNNSIPYPYVDKHRKVILKYLRKNKYKDFKKDKMVCVKYS